MIAAEKIVDKYLSMHLCCKNIHIIHDMEYFHTYFSQYTFGVLLNELHIRKTKISKTQNKSHFSCSVIKVMSVRIQGGTRTFAKSLIFLNFI